MCWFFGFLEVKSQWKDVFRGELVSVTADHISKAVIDFEKRWFLPVWTFRKLGLRPFPIAFWTDNLPRMGPDVH